MHKKKAKILVIGNFILIILGDAGSGKSSLIQTYVKKNYQFSSDYNMVLNILIYKDTRSINSFENNSIP